MIDKRVFDALTDQEFAVLYWRCQGLSHQDIADRFGYSRPWVNEHSSKLGVKLGFPKEMHSSVRDEIIRNEICPAFQEWIENHPEKVKKLPEPLDQKEDKTDEKTTDEEPKVKPLPEWQETKALVPGSEQSTEETIDGEPIDDEEYEKRKRGDSHSTDEANHPPRPRSNPRIFVLIAVGLCAILILGGTGALTAYFRNLQPTHIPTPTGITEESSPTKPVLPTSTEKPIKSTDTPTLTYTPDISFTPVALPIREDFSEPYKDIWQVIGQPYIRENTFFDYLGLKGVLTVQRGEVGGLRIGNITSPNYTIFTSFFSQHGEAILTIAFRVKDLKNYVALECAYDQTCHWVVMYEGVPEKFGDRDDLYSQRIVITAEGDTFSAVGNYENWEPVTMKFTLPPKYQGKFENGGVMLLLNSESDVDYFEIQPFP